MKEWHLEKMVRKSLDALQIRGQDLPSLIDHAEKTDDDGHIGLTLKIKNLDSERGIL
jgi:hypothetical protein